MSLVAVDSRVFDQLKRAYQDDYASPDKLIAALDQKFQHQSAKQGGASAHLISEKTIRSFFSASQPPKTRLQNLNYYCGLLLGKTYNAALESIQQAQQPSTTRKSEGNISHSVDSGWEDDYRERLRENLGKVKILDMENSLEFNQIFTQVIVLDALRRIQTYTAQELVTQLEENLEREHTLDFGRLAQAKQARRRGFDVVRANRKLIVYGKPGAGKSTFLKALALFLQTLFPDEQLIPVYIALKDFTEIPNARDLLDAIIKELEELAIAPERSQQIALELLENNRCLILLDGFDEVAASDFNRVGRYIENFVKRYPRNRFVISCRTAAYNCSFTDFVTVEIADFNTEQVEIFSRQWFADRHASNIADKFLQQLNTDPAYRELTTSPLLLTMLCWVFEARYELPKNRHVLFGEVVEVLLHRWDASRHIERKDAHFEKLSRQRKVELFSEIAYDGFQQMPQIHYWQEEDLEDIIRQFIRNIRGVEPNTLDEDTKEILKAIQANTGILIEHATQVYGFSHLAFQEYFAARHILYSGEPDLIRQIMNKHITDTKWREIFIIMAGRMSRNKQADEYLLHIFSHANKLVNRRELQEFLKWLYETTHDAGVNSSSWRAYYLLVDWDADLYIDFDRDERADRSQIHKLASTLKALNKQQVPPSTKPRTPLALIQLSLATLHVLAYDASAGRGFSIEDEHIIRELGMIDADKDEDFLDKKIQLIADVAREKADRRELAGALQALHKKRPDESAPTSKWRDWSDDLQKIMIDQLKVGYRHRFSDEDIDALRQYLYLANLILDCIQADIFASREVREQIVEHLLMPVEQIPESLLPAEHRCGFCDERAHQSEDLVSSGMSQD